MCVTCTLRAVSQTLGPVSIRLHPHLRAEAEARAAEHGRSLSAELRHALAQHYAHEDRAITTAPAEPPEA